MRALSRLKPASTARATIWAVLPHPSGGRLHRAISRSCRFTQLHLHRSCCCSSSVMELAIPCVPTQSSSHQRERRPYFGSSTGLLSRALLCRVSCKTLHSGADVGLTKDFKLLSDLRVSHSPSDFFRNCPPRVRIKKMNLHNMRFEACRVPTASQSWQKPPYQEVEQETPTIIGLV